MVKGIPKSKLQPGIRRAKITIPAAKKTMGIIPPNNPIELAKAVSAKKIDARKRNTSIPLWQPPRTKKAFCKPSPHCDITNLNRRNPQRKILEKIGINDKKI